MWPFGKRKKKSGKRMFQGAVTNRLVADWITSTTTIDSELRTSLLRLRDRSRQLLRDNDYCKSAQRTVINNVVGVGVGFQSQVRMKRGGNLNAPMNAQIESSWYKWQRKENCHAAGKLCFPDIERLVIGSIFSDGEILVRFVPMKMGDSKVPLALEIIEADMLDDTYNGIADNGNSIRMGVELNEWKRPVAYYFHANHPGDSSFGEIIFRREQRRRIPAEEILHLFMTARVNQTRGIPWLHSAIMRLHHMNGYEEAEVIAARASASLMGFIETPEEEPSIKDDVDSGQSVTEFEPGVFKKLDAGEKVNIPSLNRPGGQFDPFMRLMLRGVSAGVGASYESISKDYSQSNYSSSRLALLDDRDNWKVIQGWLIANFHQAVFERWLDMAVLSGELKIGDYEINQEAYRYPRWNARGWSWVDPQKEVAAYLAAVRAGFATQQEVIAQAGGDFEELITQRKREVDLAKENDLVFDSNPALVTDKGQIQGTTPAADNNGDPVKPAKGVV